MEITHNNLNDLISDLADTFSKGQPFAKTNKYRKIRTITKQMRIEQAFPPTFKGCMAYFWKWLTWKLISL